MSNYKKAIKSAKSILPVIKKMGPAISKITNSVDLLENTSDLAKPFLEDARSKSIEKSKRIFAFQTVVEDQVKIAIPKAGLSISEANEALALEHFVKRLEKLRDSKILNSDKKIQKAQKILIDKLNQIRNDEGEIKDYIYRIETTEAQIKYKKEKKKRILKSANKK